MKKLLVYTLGLSTLLLGACNEPEPRRPVSAKSGSFIRESIERNKKLLEAEEGLITEIVEKDSLHTYQRSSNGYWYYLETTDSTSQYYPQEEDIVRISYELRKLDSTPVYTREEIGEIEFKVDKEAFFPGMRTAVKLLREGETATFLFPSSLAYGYHGDEDKIGTNVPLMASVTLLEVVEKQTDSITTDNELE